MRFILKLILKLFVLPIKILVSIVDGVLTILLYVGAGILCLIAGVMVLVGVALIFTQQWVGAILYLVIAYLISPYGIPMIAAWLVSRVKIVNCYLREFLLS